MYNQKILTRAHNKILDEMESFRSNITELWTNEEFIEKFGENQDEFINKVTKNSLEIKQHIIDPFIKKKYLWIGINPPPGAYTMLELYNKTVEATEKYKMLREHAWTIEANTDGGYRPHVHMMIPKSVRPARVVEQLSKIYKVKANSIECKDGYSYEEHLKYIKGEKKNEKILNVEKDIVERNELGIPNFILSTIYTDGSIQVQQTSDGGSS